MRLLIALLGITLAALGIAELTMQPSSADRAVLAGIFIAVVVVAAITASVFKRLAPKASSVRRTVMWVALLSVGIVGLAVGLSAAFMVLSPHDLGIVLVSLGVGLAVGGVMAATLSNALSRDLRRMSDAADSIGTGDLSSRTGVERNDELGHLARAFDDMAERLEESSLQRELLEAARRDFVAAVGHDLRTPLTSLQAAVEALQDGLASDPDRYLRSMNSDVKALSRLVEDLSLYSRIEAGHLDIQFDDLDLGELVDEAVEALTPLADQMDVSVNLDVQGHIVVRAGGHELGRVIRNVLDNAIRFSPAREGVDVRVVRANGSAVVSVVDAGPGFPEDIDVFVPFSRGDAARGRGDGSSGVGSSGLGLAIARGIVEAHEGDISIEPGPGGRLQISLPARQSVLAEPVSD